MVSPKLKSGNKSDNSSYTLTELHKFVNLSYNQISPTSYCSRLRSVFKPQPGHVSRLRAGRFGYVSGSGQWKMALIIGF
jgi:hypothetical protein